MRDLYSHIRTVGAQFPAVYTTGDASDAIDRQGFDSAVVRAVVGTKTGVASDAYYTIQLQHSDDDITYANVEEKDILGVTPASGIIFTINDSVADDSVLECGYVGEKRYLKLTLAVVGAPTSVGLSTEITNGDALLAEPERTLAVVGAPTSVGLSTEITDGDALLAEPVE